MTYFHTLAAGTLTGILLSLLLSHRRGIPATVVLDSALAAGIGGALTGRSLYVLAHLAYFQEHPAEALALWRGGLSGFGTLIGGLLGVLALSAWRRLDPRPILAVLAPGASLVVIAAWLGCLGTGYAWGRETWPGQGLLWHLSPDLPDLYGLRAPRVPVQVMGALWGIVLLLASSLATRLRWHNGGPLWLFLYGLGDFALSFLRGDLSPVLGRLSPLQWADLGLALGALAAFLYRRPQRAGKPAKSAGVRFPSRPSPAPGWGIRASLFLLVLLTLRAPRVLVVVGPPKEVHTTNPLVGVHTRLTDEVEEWKIQRTLQMVREMGAPWIVEYFPWAYIEPRPGQFDWGHSDIVIRHARAQGLTVIARLGFVPQWARPKETTPNYIDPESYDEFAAFVAAFLTRYRGEVNHVIIWNEPNLSLEWGYRPVDPAAYTEMLKTVYSVAHAANPDAVVLAGALAPTLEPPGSPAGLNDLDYLKGMYAAGAAPYFDALAVHAYGTTFPPEADPAPDVINFRRTELLRVIMEAHGDGHKPVYITEGGWNDHPRWTRAVRPAQRVAYTIGAYEWARQNWPWCRAVVFWAFRYPAPLHNFQDYYTFVTDDFRPKPIYLAVQEYTGNEQMTE